MSTSGAAMTADVLVLGGGVAGLSTAMQLGVRGLKVIVLERQRLGSGSTGRAAGLLGQLRGTVAHTQMLMDGLAVVRELEKRTGVSIFVETGSVRVGETEERAREIRDLVAMGKSIGFDVQTIGREELSRRMPYMRTDDLVEACWCPTDGHLQPAELADAYCKAGKTLGVHYVLNAPVTEMLIQSGRIHGVRTPAGEFHAPIVVNATGPWSYLVAGLGQTRLATASIGHYYLVTRPDPKHPVDKFSPAFRNRHHRIYGRPEGGGLLVGMYEAEPVDYDMETLPSDFDMAQMKARLGEYHVALLIHLAQQRFPWINERTPMTITTGIMTFTPNGLPFLGEMPHIKGLWHCTGFSGHGIVQSPTIGVIMADLITKGTTAYDLNGIMADRYFDLPGFQERADVKARCRQMYSTYYGRVEGQKQEAAK